MDKKDIIQKDVFNFLKNINTVKHQIIEDEDFYGLGVNSVRPIDFLKSCGIQTISIKNGEKMGNRGICNTAVEQINKKNSEEKDYIDRFVLCFRGHATPIIYGKYQGQPFIVYSAQDINNTNLAYTKYFFNNASIKNIKQIVLPEIQYDQDNCYTFSYKFIKHLTDNKISDLCNKHIKKCNKDNKVVIDYNDVPKKLLKYAQTSKVFNNRNLIDQEMFDKKLAPYVYKRKIKKYTQEEIEEGEQPQFVETDKERNNKLYYATKMFVFNNLPEEYKQMQNYKEVRRKLDELKKSKQNSKY